MLEKVLHNKLLFIAIHIVIGFLATFSFFPKIYGVLVIILSVFYIVNSKNACEEALILSSYVVGYEVFIRMTGGFVLYETGKYAVILFLMLGYFLHNKKNNISITFVFYILLLFIGIVATQVPDGESIRKAIVFNLSGPIVLGVSALYFFGRRITREQIEGALFFMFLPLVSTVTFLYFRTPDIKEIVFGGGANFDTSGGFGPNQVATAIGLGVFIIAKYMLSKNKLSGYLLIDSMLLLYFIYRGLLTFSRGGMITGITAFAVFAFFYFLYTKTSLKVLLKYVIIGGVFTAGVWMYTSDITGGMINNRYTGKNAKGKQKDDISSGRLSILQKQFESFVKIPFGIGVGNGKYKRQQETTHVTAVSHNEIGRLLEEHGIIGFVLLLVLLFSPAGIFFNGTNYQRAYILAFYLFWLLTISHSAMRIAFPGFVYGLSLMNVVDENEE